MTRCDDRNPIIIWTKSELKMYSNNWPSRVYDICLIFCIVNCLVKIVIISCNYITQLSMEPI